MARNYSGSTKIEGTEQLTEEAMYDQANGGRLTPRKPGRVDDARPVEFELALIAFFTLETLIGPSTESSCGCERTCRLQGRVFRQSFPRRYTIRVRL
jgi:hypothetical protein